MQRARACDGTAVMNTSGLLTVNVLWMVAMLGTIGVCKGGLCYVAVILFIMLLTCLRLCIDWACLTTTASAAAAAGAGCCSSR